MESIAATILIYDNDLTRITKGFALAVFKIGTLTFYTYFAWAPLFQPRHRVSAKDTDSCPSSR